MGMFKELRCKLTLGVSCKSIISAHRIACPTETLDKQERYQTWPIYSQMKLAIRSPSILKGMRGFNFLFTALYLDPYLGQMAVHRDVLYIPEGQKVTYLCQYRV